MNNNFLELSGFIAWVVIFAAAFVRFIIVVGEDDPFLPWINALKRAEARQKRAFDRRVVALMEQGMLRPDAAEIVSLEVRKTSTEAKQAWLST